MYSVRSFGQMIADRVRVQAYAEALRQAIFPGATVVEIGAATGFFSLLACRLGAGRVYAIETNDAIAVARQAAAANGFADRIRFIHQLSTEVELPEKADVLISDLRGGTPLHTLHIPSIIDARTRLLKPGGAQLPVRDHLFAALVGNPRHLTDELAPWEPELDGFDWAAARRVIVNQWWKAPVAERDLLSPSIPLLSLDYTAITSPNVAASITLTPAAAGTVYGFALSFDAEIYRDAGFTTRPGQPRATVYGPAFFPLESPLSVGPSDSIGLDLRADLVGSDYVWTWTTSCNGQRKFVQSTFKANLIDPQSFKQSGAAYRPSLSPSAHAIRWILANIDGAIANQQLAAGLQAAFPAQYPSFQQALQLVTATVALYDGNRPPVPEPAAMP